MASPSEVNCAAFRYRAVTRKIGHGTPCFVSSGRRQATAIFLAYTSILQISVRKPFSSRPGIAHTDAIGRLQGQGPGRRRRRAYAQAGESFEYTSGVPLPTPSGFMVGSYGMVTEAENISTSRSAFSLDSSYAERTINRLAPTSPGAN
jgi:ApaG protein